MSESHLAPAQLAVPRSRLLRAVGSPAALARGGLVPVLLLTAAGAGLRFSELGLQSFWTDEAVTARRMAQPFWKMFVHGLSSGAAPPLFYALLWPWARVFGRDEVALRALPALFGTATIPVAYLVAATLFSRRAALVAAALVAFNPMLIWYSQEAREYSLLALLGALSFLFFARSWLVPTPRTLAGWVASSGAALATHYFALFLVLPEAAVLLASRRLSWRARTYALAGICAVGVALLPVALEQRAHGGVRWVTRTPLGARVSSVWQDFVAGPQARYAHGAMLVTTVFVVAGLVLLFLLGTRAELRRGLACLALGLGAVALPIALALVGLDYLIAKHILVALLPVAVAVAAGFGARDAGPIGVALAAGLCVVSVGLNAAVPAAPSWERDDWRGVARLVGRPGQPVLVVVIPRERVALRHYLPGLHPIKRATVRTREIDVLYHSSVVHTPRRVPPPAPGFSRSGRTRHQHFTLVRFTAARPLSVSAPFRVALPRRRHVRLQLFFRPRRFRSRVGH